MRMIFNADGDIESITPDASSSQRKLLQKGFSKQMKSKPDLMRSPCFGDAMDQTRSAVIAQALEGGHACFGLEMLLLQGCRHAEVGQRRFDGHLGLRK